MCVCVSIYYTHTHTHTHTHTVIRSKCLILEDGCVKLLQATQETKFLLHSFSKFSNHFYSDPKQKQGKRQEAGVNTWKSFSILMCYSPPFQIQSQCHYPWKCTTDYRRKCMEIILHSYVFFSSISDPEPVPLPVQVYH